ncbi:MAG: glycine zipper family protein [Flavobacteriaceae bacterium]
MKTLIQIVFILFSIGLIFSCTHESEENQEVEQIDYQQLAVNVDKHLNSFIPYFQSQESLISTFQEFKKNTQERKSSHKSLMTIHLDLSSERVEYDKDNLAEIYSDKQKEFLLAYFYEIANAKGSELLSIISFHKDALENSSFAKEEYQQLFSVLDTAEKTVSFIEDMLSTSISSKTYSSLTTKGNCFWECMAGQGRNIGRGIAGGAITGGTTGAIAGGAVGTVVFPILGTATGAVAGGVFGAAEGAIYGAIGTAFFSAADCATQCGGGNHPDDIPGYEPQCHEVPVSPYSLLTYTLCL